MRVKRRTGVNPVEDRLPHDDPRVDILPLVIVVVEEEGNGVTPVIRPKVVEKVEVPHEVALDQPTVVLLLLQLQKIVVPHVEDIIIIIMERTTTTTHSASQSA